MEREVVSDGVLPAGVAAVVNPEQSSLYLLS